MEGAEPSKKPPPSGPPPRTATRKSTDAAVAFECRPSALHESSSSPASLATSLTEKPSSGFSSRPSRCDRRNGHRHNPRQFHIAQHLAPQLRLEHVGAIAVKIFLLQPQFLGSPEPAPEPLSGHRPLVLGQLVDSAKLSNQQHARLHVAGQAGAARHGVVGSVGDGVGGGEHGRRKRRPPEQDLNQMGVGGGGGGGGYLLQSSTGAVPASHHHSQIPANFWMVANSNNQVMSGDPIWTFPASVNNSGVV
ncbi:transcription factor TCP15-like [Prunus yedoensis var. nudiflora]|uniref:Transcription factor TCP15-like n=1 Tax=Prunus yedoensis var. nudiflora TaxID=2094558 RepID=A0A314V333_PRUYE|nr:transcription factor TCP15-like [Prunus yedoensis var. nudiflora]